MRLSDLPVRTVRLLGTPEADEAKRANWVRWASRNRERLAKAQRERYWRAKRATHKSKARPSKVGGDERHV